MTPVPAGRVIFLTGAIATHAVVGYVLGAILADRPYVGAVGGVVPDIDFLFPAAFEWPFVHRGVTHTLLVATIATALIAVRHRATGTAFGAGYVSHLLIDATTPQGVPFLYPGLSESFFFALPPGGHSTVGTVILWSGALSLLYVDASGDVLRIWNSHG
ncbi:metal-dependent hydrolase [Natronoarchaeum sp. GCM10025703]|uniref:metal-dependent hydrolase n=1 Tax=unclassified Natronoarchaeum TaxID=2620183 RepID=UPI00360FC2E8